MTKQEAERQEAEERIKYWLETFGENITRIDHVIELLEDLKDELKSEKVDLHTIGINDYIYGSLTSLKLLKKDLSNDIKTIKNCLS
ncbi:hypothetical protein A6769_34920 [Nostoc punctiforme NIES-2108]|uniref:Uncharacterized protein n=1 Tax=Nostoc punctiforme NIES-2108 TaxID=1356359 RepID=A0A367R1X2_NOSPU|nr:hypothetical protein A6769_34920 [Nostoc punctiforme NIES-2108]